LSEESVVLTHRPFVELSSGWPCHFPAGTPHPAPPPVAPEGQRAERAGRPLVRGSSSAFATESATGAREHVALLLDLGGLAAQVAQVVELRATDVTAGDDLDLVDHRRVHGERALDTGAEADLADGERLANPATLPADDD